MASGAASQLLGLPTRWHILLSIPGTTLFLLSHSMVMFYFLGTGSRLKEIVREGGLDTSFLKRSREFQRRVLPPTTIAIGAVMATFVIGGGVHTELVPGWIHGILSLVGLFYAAKATALEIIRQSVEAAESLGREDGFKAVSTT